MSHNKEASVEEKDKKEEEQGKRPLELNSSWKPVLCNDVKTGRVCWGKEKKKRRRRG